jgi:predicted RND superfamily exporter protein
MLRVKDGDIFNTQTLHAIQDITDQANKMDGVDHNEVFSLSSYRVIYAHALPGVLESKPFMYPKVPDTPEKIAALKNLVQTNRDQIAGLVTTDLKGALVIASFNEGELNYKALFDGVQQIINRYQNANTRIYASGPVMFTAWGYHYLPRIGFIFFVSLMLMVLLSYLCLGRRGGWWAPVVTGACSAIWGVGFMSLRGYDFDPTMLVIPLILTARNLGHGIQWQARFYEEFDESNDKISACVAAADAMLRPGLIAVLICVAGIVFFGLSDIPVLRQIGIGGAVWLAVSLIVVFIGQPILTSYLKTPELRPQPTSDEAGWLAGIAGTAAAPGLPRLMVAGAAGLAIVIGLVAYSRVRIGYQTPGTPIYQRSAKINRDTAEIDRFVPTNFAWVVLETPEYPSPASTMGTKTLRMADDLAAYLVARGDAVAVIGFANIAEKPMNMLLHNGSPKYFALPDTELLSATLWNFFFGSSAPDEPKAYFAFEPSARNANIRLLLPDHTTARLQKLRADLDTFVQERITPDPDLKGVTALYVGGEAGLYLAIDDVTAALNLRNLILVLSAIFVIGAVFFFSILAGVLLVILAVMANALGFVYMNYHVIGLTVDTIPVISLGIGLGLSFAVYVLARIQEEAASGSSANDPVNSALRKTGPAVLGSFIVIVGGLVPWVFSPILFQNEMSEILILLMITNLIAGVIVLPALIAWLRPRFMCRAEPRASTAVAAAR